MNVLMDQNLNVQVILGDINSTGFNLISEEADVSMEGQSVDMSGMMNGEMPGAAGKDPLLSGWPFVLGISALSLTVSIVIGILLAKRKIKKGFELYED